MPTSLAVQTVSKSYVDQAIAQAVSTGVAPSASGSASQYVPTTGGSMTGPLVLPGDPVSPLQAADKNYVDENVAQVTGGVASKVSTVPTAGQTVAQPAGTQLEINRLNYKWQTAHGGSSIISYSDQFQPRSLVKSPLVLAAWQDRAKALLHHYRVATLDWDTLDEAFQAANWSEVGGAQSWGPVQFAHTLPTQSNSGLLTITLLAYHYFKEQRNLTAAQVTALFNER